MVHLNSYKTSVGGEGGATQQASSGKYPSSYLPGIELTFGTLRAENAGEKVRYHQMGASSQPQQERTARVWLSRVQKRASKLTKKRWGNGSSASSKKSSRTLGESSLVDAAKANLFLTPPARSPSPSTPPSTPVNLVFPTIPPLTLPPPMTHSPPPPLLLYPIPIQTPIPPTPPTKESESPNRRRSSAISVICDMCFEFLQLDDRPTAILEVQPTTIPVGRLKVGILFTNPAFEHLKPQLKLDFGSSASMGGILQQAGGKLVWVVPNGKWQLRCVSISRGAVTGDDTVATVGGGHRWWKVMTACPVLPLAGRPILNNNEVEEHLDTLGPANTAAVSETQPESISGMGRDFQFVAEELPQGISEPSIVITNELGDAGDWMHSPSKTITPSHTGGTNSTRRSLASSNAASRRSSRSLPSSRRDSSSVGIPEAVAERSEPLSTLSESVVGGRFVNRLNMDWTRGAMPKKNTKGLVGIDEHLRFLMDVPW